MKIFMEEGKYCISAQLYLFTFTLPGPSMS